MNSLIGLQLKTRLLKVEVDNHFIRASLRHSTEDNGHSIIVGQNKILARHADGRRPEY
jgi:hypothetical protein